MFDILEITGVIFVLLGLGYMSVRSGLFTGQDMGTLGKFVLNFALPALIFRAVSTRPLAEVADPGYLLAVLVGSLAVFWLGYGAARRLSRQSPGASTFRAMGMSCANSGFVGYPLLLMALPDVAPTALALNMIVENVVMLPMVLILAERSQSAGLDGARLARQIAGRLIRNPILISLLAGVAVSLTGLPLPRVLHASVDLMANASAALSLAVIGGTLATLPLRSLDLSILPVVAGKLLLHPLALAGAVLLVAMLGLPVTDPRLAAAAVIMAATPPMAIYPILAQRVGEERSAALVMFATTVLSFFTISAVMMLALP